MKALPRVHLYAACLVSALLIAVGVARLCLFLLHDPLLAYANNYDMNRIQACVSIWPDHPDVDPTKNWPDAPLRRYEIDESIEFPCYMSSELVFAGLGKIAAVSLYGPRFPIVVFGWTRGAVLVACVVLASLYFLARGLWLASTLNAATFALVLTDPGNTLYLSTFYSEFSALLFLYLTIIAFYLFGKGEGGAWVRWVLAGSAIGLGLSKQQHIVFPWILLVFAIWVGWGSRRLLRADVIAMIVACGVVTSAHAFYESRITRAIAHTNRVHAAAAVLYAASAEDPPFEELGLDECSEAPLIRESYPAFASSLRQACPPAIEVRHLTTLATLASNPETAGALASLAVDGTRPWVIGHYGQVEGGIREQSNAYVFSLNDALNRLSRFSFLCLFLAPGLLSLAHAMGSRGSADSWSSIHHLVAAGIYTVFGVSVLGDGLFDMNKHSHLVFSLLLFSILFNLVAISASAAHRIRSAVAGVRMRISAERDAIASEALRVSSAPEEVGARSRPWAGRRQ